MINISRKGQISIYLLVIMTLAFAAGTSMFLLKNSEKELRAEIQNPISVINLYATEEIVNLYAYKALEKAVEEGNTNNFYNYWQKDLETLKKEIGEDATLTQNIAKGRVELMEENGKARIKIKGLRLTYVEKFPKRRDTPKIIITHDFDVEQEIGFKHD